MRGVTTLLTAAVLVAVTLPVAAQQGTAEIRGRILDAHGGVVPRVTVVLGNQRRLEVFGEVFNLTNKANFELSAADRRATDFPAYTAPRAGAVLPTGRLGVRFTF
jgi:hypothetical protein